MPNLHSLIDRLYYANRREYSYQEGNVTYLDGAPLRRPLSMPRFQKLIAAAIAAVAIVIGAFFLNTTLFASLRESAAVEEAIQANLAREASIETIPIITELAGKSDDDIRKTFAEAGYEIFDATDADEENAMVLYRLPSDINTNEATGMFALGINGLSAPDASKFLNGSWYFATDRSAATSMVVRYADFSTGDPQEAVTHAVEKEGFDPAAIENSGVDDSGNTFSSGTVEIDKKPYTWKVSAIELDDMYSITGLPDEACYVGVRLTAQQA